MASSDWRNLPSVVLYDLYQLLPFPDRLAASSTCKKWRDAFCLFPNWRHLHLVTAKWAKEKNQFLARAGRQFCRSLHITYTPDTMDQVVDLLQLWSSYLRFHEFQLVSSGEPDATVWAEYQKEIFSVLEEVPVLSSLILSHVGDLDRLAKLVAKHGSSLKIFGLGRVISPLGKPDIPPQMPTNLTSFAVSNLRVLQLNGMWLCPGLLQWVIDNSPELKILSVIFCEGDPYRIHSPDSWKDFDKKLPQCQIRVTFIRMKNTQYHNLINAFNLTHVRMIFCSMSFQVNCLDALSRSQTGALLNVRSVWSMFDEKPPQARMGALGQNLMLTAWRLTRLRELLVGGCIFDHYDLVGMIRLRPSLKIIVSKEDIIVSSQAAPLKEDQTTEPNPLFTDKKLPFQLREAFIIRTLVSIDCMKKGTYFNEY